jgi:AraC-like DNA-binding protein
MERSRKYMDSPIKHWGAYRRQFPARFRVGNLDHLPRKTEWIHRAFDTCNFSLILAGGGEYRRAGVTWRVEAPAVIIQLPGEFVEYGPAPGCFWEELYVVYEGSLRAEWEACGVLNPAQPVWSIRDRAAVEAQVLELRALTRTRDPAAVVDRLDRVCERLIVETRLEPAQETADIPAVAQAAAGMRRDLTTPCDIAALAARHGMSAATFRRRWQELMPMPPARFHLELRVQEACRLLVETRRPVREIARLVGFEDELYFSRRLRLETGLAPRDYRRRYRLETGGKGSGA